MNPAEDARAQGRWSRRRWLGTVAGVLAAQLILLLFLGRPAQPARWPAPFSTAIHLAADDYVSRALRALPGADDPALFALPSHEGFSGAAWFRFAPLRHERPDWTEEPRWLDLDARRLGAGVSGLVAANPDPVLRIPDQPVPRLGYEERRAPLDAVPAQSRLRAEGSLAGRRLPDPDVLPSWAHTEILSNTVVQVGVDSEGYTRSAALLGRCGFPPADQWAFQHAMAARHPPLRRGTGPPAGDGGLTWGRLVYEWHTLPPALTNDTAALHPPPP